MSREGEGRARSVVPQSPFGAEVVVVGLDACLTFHGIAHGRDDEM